MKVTWASTELHGYKESRVVRRWNDWVPLGNCEGARVGISEGFCEGRREGILPYHGCMRTEVVCALKYLGLLCKIR